MAKFQSIPILEAQAIAKNYGYDQVVIIARSVGEGGGEHVTTYGVDKANCKVAADIGNFLKFKVMGWTEEEVIADRFLVSEVNKR